MNRPASPSFLFFFSSSHLPTHPQHTKSDDLPFFLSFSTLLTSSDDVSSFSLFSSFLIFFLSFFLIFFLSFSLHAQEEQDSDVVSFLPSFLLSLLLLSFSLPFFPFLPLLSLSSFLSNHPFTPHHNTQDPNQATDDVHSSQGLRGSCGEDP